MPDYSKTIIYKICSNNPDIKEIYVGSTCNFAKRKCKHKECCNNETRKGYNYKVYKYIRENGGWNTFDMVPIEKYPCNDKLEKTIRERYWFELLKAGLNTKYPNRTGKEYKADNADKYKQYKADYADKNKEYQKQYHKKYISDNVDKIKAYQKQYHKKYISDNADKIKQYRKQYISDNADKIKQYISDNADKIKARKCVKIACECGSSVSCSNISAHRRTTKHIKLIESKTKTAEQ